MRKGIGSHQSSKMLKDEWLTPPELIRALGEFDVDPCAPIIRPWNMAKKHYTINDDGLSKEWHGRVWCNPPYGLKAAKWLERLSEHGNGIVLTFARTETKMFFRWIWSKASALLFIEGRLHFYHNNGVRAKANSGAPSVLVAYGEKNARILASCKIKGKFINLHIT